MLQINHCICVAIITAYSSLSLIDFLYANIYSQTYKNKHRMQINTFILGFFHIEFSHRASAEISQELSLFLLKFVLSFLIFTKNYAIHGSIRGIHLRKKNHCNIMQSVEKLMFCRYLFASNSKKIPTIFFERNKKLLQFILYPHRFHFLFIDPFTM